MGPAGDGANNRGRPAALARLPKIGPTFVPFALRNKRHSTNHLQAH